MLKPVGFQYAQGIVTASYFKAADDPRWANDPAVKGFLADLKKYAPDADPTDPYSVYGWLVGETVVQTLQKMSAPTRDAMLKAAKQPRLHPRPACCRASPIKTDGQTTRTRSRPCRSPSSAGENFVLEGAVIQASSG